jgi:FAD/FMN-containing dehydrogenase
MNVQVRSHLQPVETTSLLYTDLLEALGGDRARVINDAQALAPYAEDFTCVVDKGGPQIVTRVRDVEEIRKVLAAANRHRVPVTPWSAGYGLGTSLAIEGGIILDMRLMNKIVEIDEDNLYALVEPGVTYEMLTPKLREKGLVISIPDAPAQVSVLANHTNFGIGAYLQKHGMGPDLVLGLEAVLPSGEVIRTGSSALEGHGWYTRYAYNPVPDLAGLFLGSMGTLGVVTKVAVRLFPMPEKVSYRKLGFADIATAAKAATELARKGLADRVVGFSWFFFPDATRKLADQITGKPLSPADIAKLRAQVPDVPEVYFFVGVHDEAKLADARIEVIERLAAEKYGARILPMSQDDTEKYTKVAMGEPQQQSERAILGRKGKYQGAYGTYVSYTPIHNWPAMYESWGKVAAEYGHPLAMNTKVFGLGRFSSFRFILSYFDQNDPDDRKRITEMCARLESEALRLGGVSGATTPDRLRELASYPLYKRIKQCLDPNGIMHPSMGDWSRE